MPKRCLYTECKTIPNFNYEGKTIALYCATHKLPDMIDIKHKKCQSIWCYTLISNKYEGYCRYCFIHLFPDKPVSRNYKTKEYAVVEFVKQKYPDLSWISDKKVEDGCSRRRPDLLLDLGYQIIIVEVDENQHSSYDKKDEDIRYDDLYMIHSGKWIFIRFNPDGYKDHRNNYKNQNHFVQFF